MKHIVTSKDVKVLEHPIYPVIKNIHAEDRVPTINITDHHEVPQPESHVEQGKIDETKSNYVQGNESPFESESDLTS